MASILVDPAKLYLLALLFINIYTAQTRMFLKNLQFSKVDLSVIQDVIQKAHN